MLIITGDVGGNITASGTVVDVKNHVYGYEIGDKLSFFYTNDHGDEINVNFTLDSNVFDDLGFNSRFIAEFLIVPRE